MPRPGISYIYRYDFECPDLECKAGLICVIRVFKRRQDKKHLHARVEDCYCSECEQPFQIDADKAIRRTVEKLKDGTWSTLLVLDDEGKEVFSSGPSV
jgi:hypothetical protein